MTDRRNGRRRRPNRGGVRGFNAVQLAQRAACVPVLNYPAQLPVTQRKADIAAAIEQHQVVIVAGETGSGKTTQLAKICLELGRGVNAMIGHTQPRRIAARTVAQRIAEELDVPLGQTVGYAVRFTDQVSNTTLVKLMTDGILLAEISRDPQLRRYDTLIIDEAHERGLNIDFLLGYLQRLLPRRPDLKLIITSATIDPQRFADFFSVNGAPAPIVEVSGRTYPVEIRYRPLGVDAALEHSSADDVDDPDHDQVDRPERDQTEAILDAITELSAPGHTGDILIFLSGEREIRDTADAINGMNLVNTEVLPLYARLGTAEQQKVFATHSARRIVLATNVAETSLTVPGVHYVIDPGTARISRYSHRTKVQRLPIEPISQASANQRAGRCGRVANGICIRLYSQADYESRPRFTDPEILRTNLAAVILQMTALRLGDIAAFGFLDPPDVRSVRDGVVLLTELGALDESAALTPIGTQLSRLPVDPRVARMIVAAAEHGCVSEILVIAAALSIPDPRERPSENAPAAAAMHARFVDDQSDFLGYLNLWNYLKDKRSELSGNQFRRLCREEYLHFLRIREWQDLRSQLRQLATGLGFHENVEPASASAVHAAVVAGLLSHVGIRQEGRDYLGARNSRFVIAPGSALARKGAQFVVAAELVETSRLYARVVAAVDPQLVERQAAHLVRRNYSEPHWDARRGATMAYERVTLYGVVLVARRRVDFGAIDPELARDLFIRHALVQGDWNPVHDFWHKNLELLAEVRELEERSRRRDLIVGEDDIYHFYDTRVPADITSVRHFDSWWKRMKSSTPELLTMSRTDLVRAEVDHEHPHTWQDLPVSYRFDPGSDDDGVTVHVPVGVLARLGGAEFSWQVPTLREELVTELIRSLPKDIRRNFVPVPDTTKAVLAGIGAELAERDLLAAVQAQLQSLRGILVPISAFDISKVPAHLRMNFSVEDEHGTVLGRGRDLDVLQKQLATSARAEVARIVGADLVRTGLRDWPDIDVIPHEVSSEQAAGLVLGFPALVDTGETVELVVLPTRGEQQLRHHRGLRRLVRLTVPAPDRALISGLTTRDRLVLASNPDGSVPELVEDVVLAALDDLTSQLIFTRAEFTQLQQRARKELASSAHRALLASRQVLTAAHEVKALLTQTYPREAADSVTDVRQQLLTMLPRGFVQSTGTTRLPELVRYCEAMARRLQQLPRDIDRDRARMERVQLVHQAYDELATALPSERAAGDDVVEIRWQLEELRVSLFAQQLGTPRPVSEQRIYRAIDSIQA